MSGRQGRWIARREDDRGAVAVLTAIIVSALVIPLAAIVVDLGYVRVQRDQAQTAADAAALAAATSLKAGATQGDARTVAETYIRQNLSDDEAGRFAANDCVGGCFSVVGKTVTVQLPAMPSEQFFAGSTPSVAGSATASWGPTTQCVICIDGELTVGSGTTAGYLKVSGGDVAVNGYVETDAYYGVNPAGTIETTDGRTLYTGGWYSSRVVTTPPTAAQQVSSATIPDMSAVTDRLDALRSSPALKLATHADDECAPESGTLLAYFDSSYPVTSCVSFAPGVYFLTANSTTSTVRLNGSTTPCSVPGGATGALFYLTCGHSDGRPGVCGSWWWHNPAHLHSSSVSGVTVKALQGSPYPELNGYSIVTDPENTDQQTLGNLTVEGDIATDNTRVNGLTVAGRLVAGYLTTGNTLSPASLSISLDTSTIDGPVRLIS